MKEIEILMKIESIKQQEIMLFQLLGKYGDNLPEEISEDMRRYANDLNKKRDSLVRKAVKIIGG